MRFKYYFLNLSLFQKIEFYLIPLFIVIFVYLNIGDIVVEKNIKNEDIIVKEIESYQLKIKELNSVNKTKNTDQIQILKQYELLAQNLTINITNINFQTNNLYIEFNGKYLNSIGFLNIVEKMNKISFLNFSYENSILCIKAVFDSRDFNNINFDNIQTDNSVANPFIKIKDKNSTTIDSISKAIIGEYVILNGVWYKVGDNYQKYTIYKIYDNYIELKYGDKITKMEIFKI
ncbi:MAG: hypothetical protein KAJ49_07650 [Arcobacteraceae bacterium]|nr:hypothetical protein [Arcobacteraceae bacterium]